MVRILHSADWQMGLRAQHVASVAPEIRRARLEAARALIHLANQQGVHAVVLAGDIFEDNLVDDRLVHEVVAVLAESRAPVYVLPGNHDALTADAVYRRASWKQRPGHIFVLDGDTGIPIVGTSALLLPAPLRQKKGMKDPTAGWSASSDSKAIRIGVAHGSLRIEGKHAADDFPIALDAAARGGLDYLALGHWHGQYIHEQRTAYAGAHETTKFGEAGSGKALLVEIASHGAIPQLTSLPTGSLAWHTLDLDLTQGGEQAVELARAFATTVSQPKKTLLKLRVTGTSSDEDTSRLKGLEDWLQGRDFLHVGLERHDIPRAQAEGRLADIATSSGLVASLVDALGSQSPSSPEPLTLATRELLAQLAMEVWK